MSKILSIVGRPNVGKSTLFNRLVGSREAIEDPTSGVTRDRHYGRCSWNGKDFSVIDTGGYIEDSDDVFEMEIRKQVELAIEESDLILFLLDSIEGLTSMDVDLANILRKSKKKVILVPNKVDNTRLQNEAAEFYTLGFEKLFLISSTNGSGTGELLDEIVSDFEVEILAELPDVPKLAIVGRPNVGKSSFINTILETDRSIVTPIPGTTRDSIYIPFKKYNFDFLLIDTAGLRRKTKVSEDVEFYSVLRSVRAIENSDVCILMIDAEKGIEAQDINIFSLIQRNKKGVLIAVNKWDLLEKTTNSTKHFEADIRQKIAPFTDVPIIFTSVLFKQRVLKALEMADHVYKNKKKEIATNKLNKILLPIIEALPPPIIKGRKVKIKYITQLPTQTPTFAFFCNHPQYVKDPYKRFLENKMRELFDFSGVPIQIFFRQK